MNNRGKTSFTLTIEQTLLEELEEIFGNAEDNILFSNEDQTKLTGQEGNDTLRINAGDGILLSRSVIKCKQAV